MSHKSKKSTFTTILKWVVAAICCLLGLKVLITVATLVSTGLALATVAFWGSVVVAVGGGAAFLGFKLLGKKK